MVLQAHFVEIDTLVGALDAGVRQVLVAITEVIAPFVAKAKARADMIAELEAGAELAADSPVRKHFPEVEADGHEPGGTGHHRHRQSAALFRGRAAPLTVGTNRLHSSVHGRLTSCRRIVPLAHRSKDVSGLYSPPRGRIGDHH